MNRNISLLTTAYILFIFVSVSYGEGLNTLIEMGKAQAEIQKAYTEETKIYKAVRNAIDHGAIKKGDPKENIKSKYGSPVVTFYDQASKRDKWVYRPASSDAFKGERVNIYFSDSGLIDEIELIK